MKTYTPKQVANMFLNKLRIREADEREKAKYLKTHGPQSTDELIDVLNREIERQQKPRVR